MKKIVTVIMLVCGFSQINAQHSLNDYKYVIVEKQFHFQNEANQYDLNELTRFLFKKNGFRPILESDIFPNDLKSNYCLALQSEVKSKGVLRTTVTITLKDCNNNLIFSADASTKEKDFDKVYSYAIRMAFDKFKGITYNYTPNDGIDSKPIASIESKTKKDSAEVDKLKAEIEQLKKEKEDAKKIVKIEPKVEKRKKIKPKKREKSAVYLEAIATDSGYNLANSETKKVQHVIIKTGMDNVFIVKGNNGLVYKKDGQWIREYIKGKKTVLETLNVIFQ